MSPDTPVMAVNGLHDIRGPVGIPGAWLSLWVVLAVAVAVLLAILALRFFRKESKAVEVPPPPAWETALAELARLEREGYGPRGLVKEYYSGLSGIIRWYIEERFDIRAPEMTTEEFMQAARYSEKLSVGQQEFLEGLLRASDMVKFAKSLPSVEEMARSFRLARAFVQEAR